MAAAVLLACALPSVAGAQSTRVVTTNVDHPPNGCDLADCTLREALAEPSITEIQLPHDFYSLEDDPLVISRPLTIRGIQDELATIVANSETQDRVITIAPEISVQLFRLRIEGGNEEDPPGGFPDEGLGGGLYVPVSSSLAVTDSEIAGNRAVSGGGIWSAGPLTLTRTTVADNVAAGVGTGLGLGGGVGLNNTSTPVTFTNTTFGRNEAFGLGGGIYTQRSMTMRNVSIVENEAPLPDPNNHGGGLHQEFTAGDQTVASNTLVARNAGGGCGGTLDFPIASTSGLLDEIGATLPSCNVTPNPGDNIIADSVIGSLQDNGGLTRTYAYLAGSRGMDEGVDCPADDQRGLPRRVFACDIGAYEFGADNLTADVSVFTDELTQPGCTVDHCTLRERVETADDDDEIILEAGTYELTAGEPLELDQGLLEFEGAGVDLTTIDANGTSRIGIVEGEAEARFTGVTVTGGNAVGDEDFPGHGGAFRIQPLGMLRLDQTHLVGNVASMTGGAVSNTGNLLFTESTASGNRVEGGSPALGGGIYTLGQNDGHSTIENSTVSGNVATTNGGNARGGGIYIGDQSQLLHLTISGNTADGGGSGLYAVNGPAGLNAILVAGNAGPECGVEGNLTGDHNLADDTTCGFNAVGDLQGVDARLAPLGNYGGPTPTHALNAGSAAIDGAAADQCPPEDQRLVTRPDGPCDIGAYEGSLPQPSPPSGGGTSQPPPDDELPEPEAGKTVNVLPEGTVKVKLPGRNRFRTLTEGEQLPVGTIVDTLKGRVTLIAAGGQTADFFGGIFRIGQGKGARPLTTLTLVEALSCPKAGKAIAAAKKKKRRLWGDGSGKFRTKGKHSAATVVGTRWLVEDRCTSTLTRVVRGRVSVRDFVKKKTVTVRAGKKYIARAKKK